MLQVISELKGNLGAVAIADLEAGGEADNQKVASDLGIAVAQVYVTRSQYRKRVRERVLLLEKETVAKAAKL